MASFSEAMELDSAPTAPPLPPDPVVLQRYLDAKDHAKKASRSAKILRRQASVSPEAKKLYEAARLVAKQANDEATKLKREAGVPSKPRKRSTANRDNAMTGAKMSTRSGITKKTKVKMPKVTKQPLNKIATGTGVYGWSANDGNKELNREEIQELQAKRDMQLLLPPPQMEAEAAAAPRATRAERKEVKRALALAAAAEEAHEKGVAERKMQRMAGAGGRLTFKTTLLGELDDLQADQRAFMGKVTIADLRNEEARKERVRAVGALEACTAEENTEIDAIAEQLGLVSMGRKR